MGMKQYIVDAFTDKPFSGNPAAVCVMDKWPSDEFMARAISEYLNNNEIKIMSTDYLEAIKGVRKRDFVFLDPPYYPTGKDSFIRDTGCPGTISPKGR